MPAINMSSIMSKVGTYSRSVSGKLRMKECIDKYAADGKGKTAGGGKVMTETDMLEAGAKLIQVLQETARACDLPQSIMQHFNSLECSKPIKMPDGSTLMYVYFEDNLRRESLDDGINGYTGEGIDNIVALFNNGYHASDYVYGWWDGHQATASTLFRSGSDIKANYAWVRSQKDREGLHFIQQAVDDFNGNYGTEYHVTATAWDVYQ